MSCTSGVYQQSNSIYIAHTATTDDSVLFFMLVCFVAFEEPILAILAIFFRDLKHFLMYFHRPKLQGGVPKLTNMRWAQLPDDKSGDLEWSTIFG